MTADCKPIGFKDFCELTSLHGWGIMAFRGFKKGQVFFWLLAIIVSSIAMIHLTKGNISEFLNDVEYNVESMAGNLDQVYFPAIYASNAATFRRSVMANWLKLDPKWKDHTFNATTNSLQPLVEHYQIIQKALAGHELQPQELQTLSLWMSSEFTEQMKERFINENKVLEHQFDKLTLFHNHSVQYKDTVTLQRQMQDLKVSNLGYFGQIFGYTQLSDFLTLLSFNGEGVLHFGGGFSTNRMRRNWFLPFYQSNASMKIDLKTFVKPTVKGGRENGLNFMLDGEFWDSIEAMSLVGYTIGLVHPLDTELIDYNGIEVVPGQYVKIKVSTEVIKTHPDIRMEASKRFCYFDEEIELDHFPSDWFRYSIDNCLFEAYLQKVEEVCNCTDYIAKSKPNKYEYCDGSKLGCLQNIQSYLTIGTEQEIVSKGQRHACYVNCNDQPFKASVTSVKFSEDAKEVQYPTFRKLNETCKSFKRDMLEVFYPNICNQVEEMNGLSFDGNPQVLKYARENVVGVSVLFDKPYVQVTERQPKMSQSTLVSNVGGILGLCLGFSVLSVVEIIYFVLLWVLPNLKSSRPSTNVSKIYSQAENKF